MRHLSVAALLLGIGSAGAQQNATTVKSLRMKILSEMDPMVPPSMGPGPWGQGNEVKVQFRVFKVLGVDIASGRLRFKAWRRMRWFDDRLKWNPVRACGRAPVDLKSVASGLPPLCMSRHRRSSTESTRSSSIRGVPWPPSWTTTCGCRT